nr:expressed protein [Hymenolepis microstoma]
MGRRMFNLSSSSCSSTTTDDDSEQRSEPSTDTSMSEISEEYSEPPTMPTNINRIKVKNFVSFTPNINLSLPECQFANGEVDGANKTQEILSSAMPAMMQSIEQCLQLATRYFKPSESSNLLQDMPKCRLNGNVVKVAKSSNIQTGLVNGNCIGVKRCADAKQTHEGGCSKQNGDAPKRKESASTSKPEGSLRNFQKPCDSLNSASRRAMKNELVVSNCPTSHGNNTDKVDNGNECNGMPLFEPTTTKCPTGISQNSINALKNGANGTNGVKCGNVSVSVSRHAANINKYLTYLQDKYSTRTCHPNEPKDVGHTGFETIPLNTGTINSFGRSINQSINGSNGNSASQMKVLKTCHPVPPKPPIHGTTAVNGVSGNSNSQKDEINDARTIIWTTMARELWKILFQELEGSNTEEIAKKLTNRSTNANCSRVVAAPKGSLVANELFPISCEK